MNSATVDRRKGRYEVARFSLTGWGIRPETALILTVPTGYEATLHLRHIAGFMRLVAVLVDIYPLAGNEGVPFIHKGIAIFLAKWHSC